MHVSGRTKEKDRKKYFTRLLWIHSGYTKFRPLETHAGQLLWAHTSSIGANTCHTTLAWMCSGCKHVEMTQKLRRGQILTPVHMTQSLVHNQTLQTFAKAVLLFLANKTLCPQGQSLICCSCVRKLSFPSSSQEVAQHIWNSTLLPLWLIWDLKCLKNIKWGVGQKAGRFFFFLRQSNKNTDWAVNSMFFLSASLTHSLL